MARKEHNKKKSTLNLEQLRNLGITNDPHADKTIEEIDGSELHGGRYKEGDDKDSGSVCQNWPTMGRIK